MATVLNMRACRDTALQDVLREIALMVAEHQFVIKASTYQGYPIENQTGSPGGTTREPENNSGNMQKTVV